MKRLFSNIEFLFAASVLIVLASAAASIWSNQWHWFGRSGAILTIAGLLLTFRPLVRMGLVDWIKTQSHIDCGHVVPTPAEIKISIQSKIDARASKSGVIMALIGTIIWAYGDLLGGIPS
jgi:hypothetical protein